MMICLGGFYTKDHLTRLSKIDHLTSQDLVGNSAAAAITSSNLPSFGILSNQKVNQSSNSINLETIFFKYILCKKVINFLIIFFNIFD